MTKAVRVEKDYLGTVVEYGMAETKVRPQPWGKTNLSVDGQRRKANKGGRIKVA